MLNGEYDIVVAGAGILGTCSAYYLKKNNPEKKILLLDRNLAAGQGNTARSNAMFRDTFSSKDNQILAKTSIGYYSALNDIGLAKTGYLWLLSSDQAKQSESYIRSMVENGVRVAIYSKEDLESKLDCLNLSPRGEEADLIEAPEIEQGIFGFNCGRLDPDKLTNHYLREYTNLGGNIALDVDAMDFTLGSKRTLGLEGEPFVWQEAKVETLRVQGSIAGRIAAKCFVLACGAWTNSLLEPLGIDGHVKAKKRQLFKVRVQNDSKLSLLMRNSQFNSINTLPFIILPKAGCFVKAIPENQELWIGCDDDIGQPFVNNPSKDIDREYRADIEYYNRNIQPILDQYLPDLAGSRPSQMWAGLYSYNTVDYLPFVFEESNLIVVGGDSGSGIMKGDSLGRIVDARYRGESEAELFGGIDYKTSKLGFRSRDVEREEWVL